jgi:putative acetyltransferase
MRTKQTHLRKGVAAAILSHILEQAKNRDYTQLSLETGSMAVFEPAQKLYQRFGFDYCQPFGSYAADPHSLFMTKQL